MQKNILVIKRRDIFLILICFLWAYESLIRYISIFLERIPLLGSVLSEYLPPVTVILLLLLSIVDIIRRLKISDFLFGLGIILFAAITLLLNLETTKFFNEIAVNFLCFVFPLYYIGKAAVSKALEDRKWIEWLTITSFICMCAILIIGFRSGFQVDAEWMSNMYVPYMLLPHLLMLMATVFERFNPVFLIVFFLGSFYLMMLGNRGSVICYLVMLLFMIAHKAVNLKLKKKIILFLLLLVLIGIVAFTDIYHSLLLSLYEFAKNSGYSTRVFLFFLQDDSSISFDSGRGDIISTLIKAIFRNPLGYGLTGDRYIVNSYAHNLFVELLIEFGLIFGTILIIILVIQVIKCFLIMKYNWDLVKVVCILFCVGFVKLFISGSYLSEPYFFLFLGVVLGINQSKNILRGDPSYES